MATVLAEKPPGAGVKVYRRGTHRTVDPAITLARVQPHLAAMGITRVGNVTGLDRIGVPVVMVARPNARSLAEGLATIPGVSIDPSLVQTNILFFEPKGIDGAALLSALKERGILCSGSAQRVRLVTHYGIERENVEYVIEAVREVAASLS